VKSREYANVALKIGCYSATFDVCNLEEPRALGHGILHFCSVNKIMFQYGADGETEEWKI
jgi:hypothetical protein